MLLLDVWAVVFSLASTNIRHSSEGKTECCLGKLLRKFSQSNYQTFFVLPVLLPASKDNILESPEVFENRCLSVFCILLYPQKTPPSLSCL